MKPQELIKILRESELICRYDEKNGLIYGGGWKDYDFYANISVVKDCYIIDLNNNRVYFGKDNLNKSYYDEGIKTISFSSLEEAGRLVVDVVHPRNMIEEINYGPQTY
jgi:hypothetical protein